MTDKKFIYVYYEEEDLLWKINDLKEKGYKEEDMYIIVKDKENLLMTKGGMEVNVESAGLESWKDRFASFLLGDKPIRDALLRIGLSEGLSEEEADKHYTDVVTGGMLLYVDTTGQSAGENIHRKIQAASDYVEEGGSI